MKTEEYKALRRELDATLANHAAHFIVLSAVIQTHPRHEDLQMAITNALELLLPTMPASDEMKERTRSVVEHLQQLRPADPGAPGVKARLAISKNGSVPPPGR